MLKRARCDICNALIPPHAHYVVRIEVFADPSIPEMGTEALAEMDAETTLQELLDQMKGLSADDLQDQVHRRFDYRLCGACQKRFLANPLGLPRAIRPGEN